MTIEQSIEIVKKYNKYNKYKIMNNYEFDDSLLADEFDQSIDLNNNNNISTFC